MWFWSKHSKVAGAEILKHVVVVCLAVSSCVAVGAAAFTLECFLWFNTAEPKCTDQGNSDCNTLTIYFSSVMNAKTSVGRAGHPPTRRSVVCPQLQLDQILIPNWLRQLSWQFVMV